MSSCPLPCHLFSLLLSTVISNTLSLCFSLNMKDQALHSYTGTDKITVIYHRIYIYILDSKLEDKGFCTELHQVFPDFILLLISS